MKKLKRVMLLTALCAIISCGSGGGGGSPEVSNVPTPIIPGSPTVPVNPVTPTNPGNPGTPGSPTSPVTPSVVVNNTRYTTTPDITKLKEGIYDAVKYTQDGNNASHNGHTTTIGAMKYGFDVTYGFAEGVVPEDVDISSPTVINVKKDGAAFRINVLGEGAFTKEAIKV